jgi:hypothetical protein
MAGARSVISHNPPTKVFEPKAKRPGPISPTEQALVTQFVLDQPREVTTAQVTALSKVLRRSKEAVKGMLEKAREEFQSQAEFYVGAHKTSVDRALNVKNREGEYDPKALDVAARASQWALENLSAEGQRIVDKPTEKGNSGPRIMVGVSIGGLNTPAAAVEVVEIPVSEQAKADPSF